MTSVSGAGGMSWVELLLKMIGDDDAEPAALTGVVNSRAGSDPNHDRVGWMSYDRVPPVMLNGRRLAPGTTEDTDDTTRVPAVSVSSPTGVDGGVGERPGVRVWRDGTRMRIEELDGRVVLIAGVDVVWAFDDDDPRPRELPRDRLLNSPAGVGVQLAVRQTAEEWLTGGARQVAASARPVRGPVRPTGPVQAVTFLDRPAWAVELEWMQGAPGPVQLVVDDQTGLLLQRRCDEFSSVARWQEFAVADSLDPELFEWDGEVRPLAELQAAAAQRSDAERAQQQQWFADQVTAQPLTAETELTLQGVRPRPDGSFTCLLNANVNGTLSRRPRSDAPWDSTPVNTNPVPPVVHTWSDAEWDWRLQLNGGRLSDAAQQQLIYGTTRPEDG